eukprot:6190401-Pleurochrysis_carterae.AAC.4
MGKARETKSGVVESVVQFCGVSALATATASNTAAAAAVAERRRRRQNQRQWLQLRRRQRQQQPPRAALAPRDEAMRPPSGCAHDVCAEVCARARRMPVRNESHVHMHVCGREHASKSEHLGG